MNKQNAHQYVEIYVCLCVVLSFDKEKNLSRLNKSSKDDEKKKKTF